MYITLKSSCRFVLFCKKMGIFSIYSTEGSTTSKMGIFSIYSTLIYSYLDDMSK